MRLFLIRHGESVDNVAGVYAGSRDSPLTWHGVCQSQCLATHLTSKTTLQRIFSSNLQRAAKTAEAIVEEQRRVHHFEGSLEKLACLREKDYGSLEGVRFDARFSRKPRDSETKESMEGRVREFVEQHLVPLIDLESAHSTSTCAVVAHGTILSVLYDFLIRRGQQHPLEMPSSSPNVARSPNMRRHTASWWNAGITECTMSAPHQSSTPLCRPRPWVFQVIRQNNTSYLRNVKRTRGGIGSAAFDKRQRTLTSYFSPPYSSTRQADEQSASSS